MESVFYAKRSKDTTFFDRLATKKNEDKRLLYFGAASSYLAQVPIINTWHAQKQIKQGYIEKSFGYKFAIQQQSCQNRTELFKNNSFFALIWCVFNGQIKLIHLTLCYLIK